MLAIQEQFYQGKFFPINYESMSGQETGLWMRERDLKVGIFGGYKYHISRLK